jgi:mannosyltransferase OCH1-like enzyme
MLFPQVRVKIMSIPKIIHQVWLGGPVPEQQRAWMETVRAKHPSWKYVLWDDAAVKRLATYRFLPRCVKASSRSNVVRLDVVNTFGGVYLDADIECLKPLDPLLESRAFAGDMTMHTYCSAVFGAEAGHNWIKRQVARLPFYVDRYPPWGPDLFSEDMTGVTIHPRHFFYPFLWDEEPVIHPESYLVHYWSRTWR